MINGYIKQLTWSKFLGSAGKRIGSACVRLLPNAIISTLPLWVRIPITFATQTSGQYFGREFALWVISSNTTTIAGPEKEIYIDGFLVVDPDEEIKIQSLMDEFEIIDPDDDELMIINATLPDQTPNPEIVSYTSSCKKYLVNASKSLARSGVSYVVTMTGSDIAEKTGAAISSAVATTTFVMVMGPPSLFSLPLVFVFEGTAKSMGAYFSRQLYEYYSSSLAETANRGLSLTGECLVQTLHQYLAKPEPSADLLLEESDNDFRNDLSLFRISGQTQSGLAQLEIIEEYNPQSDSALHHRNAV
ncbi:MAG: hypothetical protein U1E78_11480 [Gammaproteobacteria bacterium]